jgi:integrase
MNDLIAAYARHMTAAGFSLHTVADRTELLRRVQTDLPFGLDSATVEDLADWLARPGWSVQTRATYYGHLRGYYRFGCGLGRLASDPSAGIVRPRVPRGLPRPATDTQVTKALAHLSDPWRTFVLLATYAGARAGEIARLDRHDITEEDILIKGKGGKSRAVPTRAEVWRAVRSLPRGPVAHRLDGLGVSSDYVSNLTAQSLYRIGVKVTLHNFRHWFATNLLRHGADLRTVQELMGHESPSTTAIYTLITDEQRRMAIAALPVLSPASA